MDKYFIEQFIREINSTVKSNALNQLCCAFGRGKAASGLHRALTK